MSERIRRRIAALEKRVDVHQCPDCPTFSITVVRGDASTPQASACARCGRPVHLGLTLHIVPSGSRPRESGVLA